MKTKEDQKKKAERFRLNYDKGYIYPRQSTRKNVHVVATDLQGMSIHSMLFFLSVLPSKYTVVQLLIVLLLEHV